jgi:hypothetical protein
MPDYLLSQHISNTKARIVSSLDMREKGGDNGERIRTKTSHARSPVIYNMQFRTSDHNVSNRSLQLSWMLSESLPWCSFQKKPLHQTLSEPPHPSAFFASSTSLYIALDQPSRSPASCVPRYRSLLRFPRHFACDDRSSCDTNDLKFPLVCGRFREFNTGLGGEGGRGCIHATLLLNRLHSTKGMNPSACR